MDSNNVAIKFDDAPTQTRALQVMVNQGTKQAQLIMLAHGHQVPQGAITFTPEELHQHILGCIKAFELLQGPVGQKKLVLPNMIGGKPFMP
jgi:hypothetical protein